MVPYVRKSFWKHYKTGVKYIEGIDNEIYIDCAPEELSIEHNWYKNTFPKVYKYALDMTTREVYQAAEAMYHNLNTLQSRSGNQLNTRWLAS